LFEPAPILILQEVANWILERILNYLYRQGIWILLIPDPKPQKVTVDNLFSKKDRDGTDSTIKESPLEKYTPIFNVYYYVTVPSSRNLKKFVLIFSRHQPAVYDS
jgi:hypothetical protein